MIQILGVVQAVQKSSLPLGTNLVRVWMERKEEVSSSAALSRSFLSDKRGHARALITSQASRRGIKNTT